MQIAYLLNISFNSSKVKPFSWINYSPKSVYFQEFSYDKILYEIENSSDCVFHLIYL